MDSTKSKKASAVTAAVVAKIAAEKTLVIPPGDVGCQQHAKLGYRRCLAGSDDCVIVVSR
jgi:hypothetical protein